MSSTRSIPGRTSSASQRGAASREIRRESRFPRCATAQPAAPARPAPCRRVHGPTTRGYADSSRLLQPDPDSRANSGNGLIERYHFLGGDTEYISLKLQVRGNQHIRSVLEKLPRTAEDFAEYRHLARAASIRDLHPCHAAACAGDALLAADHSPGQLRLAILRPALVPGVGWNTQHRAGVRTCR